MYGFYYQAKALKEKTWFIIGVIKSEDNLAFVRTIDKQKGILEFFVPPSQNQKFLRLVDYFAQKGLLSDFTKKENRLKKEPVFT